MHIGILNLSIQSGLSRRNPHRFLHQMFFRHGCLASACWCIHVEKRFQAMQLLLSGTLQCEFWAVQNSSASLCHVYVTACGKLALSLLRSRYILYTFLALTFNIKRCIQLQANAARSNSWMQHTRHHMNTHTHVHESQTNFATKQSRYIQVEYRLTTHVNAQSSCSLFPA